DAAELLNRCLHQRAYLVAFANIAAQAQRIFRRAANPLRRGLGPAQVARAKHQFGALLQKEFSNRLADTHGGSGNYSYFVLQLHGSFLVGWKGLVKLWTVFP